MSQTCHHHHHHHLFEGILHPKMNDNSVIMFTCPHLVPNKFLSSMEHKSGKSHAITIRRSYWSFQTSKKDQKCHKSFFTLWKITEKSSFVFCKRKRDIQVWNVMRVNDDIIICLFVCFPDYSFVVSSFPHIGHMIPPFKFFKLTY